MLTGLAASPMLLCRFTVDGRDVVDELRLVDIVADKESGDCGALVGHDFSRREWASDACPGSSQCCAPMARGI